MSKDGKVYCEKDYQVFINYRHSHHFKLNIFYSYVFRNNLVLNVIIVIAILLVKFYRQEKIIFIPLVPGLSFELNLLLTAFLLMFTLRI